MAYVDNRVRTFIAGEVLAANRLVKPNSTTPDSVVYADATDTPIGVTEREAFTIGDRVAVRMLNSGGTMEVAASGAIACNAELFGINDGKVNDTDPGSGVKVGIALDAAAADGDIIEMYPVQTPL